VAPGLHGPTSSEGGCIDRRSIVSAMGSRSIKPCGAPAPPCEPSCATLSSSLPSVTLSLAHLLPLSLSFIRSLHSLHHSLCKATRPPSNPHDAGELDHISYLGRAIFRRGSMMTKEVPRASEQVLPRRPWVQPARLHMLRTDTRFGGAREASSSK
jgi:hypothetical protein